MNSKVALGAPIKAAAPTVPPPMKIEAEAESVTPEKEEAETLVV